MTVTDPGVVKFYAEHAAGGPTHVVMVDAICGAGGQERWEVFSTLAEAQKWVDSLGEEWAAVYIPKVIDVPEYGNVPEGERQ